jgi:hypothetical protein
MQGRLASEKIGEGTNDLNRSRGESFMNPESRTVTFSRNGTSTINDYISHEVL